jgi:uncharacterized protein
LKPRAWVIGAAGALLLAGGTVAYRHITKARSAGGGFTGASECQGTESCGKACDGGNTCACGTLGALYLHGSTVARDAPRGISLLDRACDAGCPTACWALGSAYQGGAGVRGDTDRAKKYFERLNTMCKSGCDGGNADQCFTLAGAYSSGHGVTPDRDQAQKLYGKAGDLYEPDCAKGDAHACARLGVLADHGLGMEESKPKALPLYEKACRAGDLESCEETAKLYDGRNKDLARDEARAHEFGHLACAGGRAVGCAIANEPLAFMEIEEAACTAGGRFECGSAAFALATGSHGVARDLARAVPLAHRMLELEQKDCADDDGSACAALARPFESGSAEGEPEGTVVTRDAAQAAVLRKRACDLGFLSACPQKQNEGPAPRRPAPQ